MTSPAHVPAAPKPKPQKAKDPDDEYEDDSRFTKKQKIIIGTSVGVIVAILLYYFLPNFFVTDADGPRVAATVPADQLLKDFNANRLEAAKKYSAGHLIVTGEVAEIFADKRPRIRFKTPEKGKGFVEAVFSHPNDLKDIQKSKKITVRGEIESGPKNRILEISMCKVIPEPAAK